MMLSQECPTLSQHRKPPRPDSAARGKSTSKGERGRVLSAISRPARSQASSESWHSSLPQCQGAIRHRQPFSLLCSLLATAPSAPSSPVHLVVPTCFLVDSDSIPRHFRPSPRPRPPISGRQQLPNHEPSPSLVLLRFAISRRYHILPGDSCLSPYRAHPSSEAVGQVE